MNHRVSFVVIYFWNLDLRVEYSEFHFSGHDISRDKHVVKTGLAVQCLR